MKKISLFDLDHTLLSANCSFLFGSYLYKQKIFSTFTMIKLVGYYSFHRLRFLSLQELHQNIFKQIFLGRKADSIKQFVKPFIEQNLKNHLYAPAINRLQSAKENNHFVSILSNSPDFLVEPVAAFLGVDDWKATVYEVNEEGKFSEISSFFQGENKAEYLSCVTKRFSLAKEHVIAYSDSFLDLSFLRAAGTAVAVNPDRKLKCVSRKNNWEII